MKVCKKCGIEKEYAEFYKDKYYKDGYKSSCRECEKRYSCTCKECGKDFKSTHKAMYCSGECQRGNITHKCANCGVDMVLNRSKSNKSDRHFCSKECYYVGNSGENSKCYTSEVVKCVMCDKEVAVTQSHKLATKNITCSIKCKADYQAKYIVGENNPNYKGGEVELECKYCKGKYHKIIATAPTSKYCSKECMNNDYKTRYAGVNNPNYNPDITDEERITKRKIAGYKDWVKSVYTRDKHKCVICGQSPSNGLIAHHKNSYHWDKANRLNVDNGVTVCRTCHTGFHTEYSYLNNTAEQFEEYKLKATTI